MEKIDEQYEDGIDVFKRNMMDRYLDRPNRTFSNGKYSILDCFCYAELLAHYYLLPKNSIDSENYSQPMILEEFILEGTAIACNYHLLCL